MTPSMRENFYLLACQILITRNVRINKIETLIIFKLIESVKSVDEI
jgi:hypothetical protein